MGDKDKRPKATPYESGIFELKIKFPENYPFRAPSIYFLTKIFHVNIHYDGTICSCTMDHLINNCWSPHLKITDIITKIINILKFPDFEQCHLYGYPSDLADRCISHRDYKYYNKIANEWSIKYAKGHPTEFLNKGGNITEYNKEIEELITNYENELDKVNKFYLKLQEAIEENKNNINNEKNQLNQLKQKLTDLNGGNYYYLNECKLKDLRDDLIKKDKEISELNLYIPLPIKETLMTVTIISSDEKFHFTTISHKSDYFSGVKELLYEKYPEYKNDKNIFYLGNKKVDEKKNLEKNGVKDNDVILLKSS